MFLVELHCMEDIGNGLSGAVCKFCIIRKVFANRKKARRYLCCLKEGFIEWKILPESV